MCKQPTCLIKADLILANCREHSVRSGAITSFSSLLRKALTLKFPCCSMFRRV